MYCERCHATPATSRSLTIALDGGSTTPAQFTLCPKCADLGAEMEPIESVHDFLTTDYSGGLAAFTPAGLTAWMTESMSRD